MMRLKNYTWENSTVLITGGTGTFGQKCTEILLKEYNIKKVIIFSRDEWKQDEMRKVFPDIPPSKVRYLIGDIRDKDRLLLATQDVDIIIHAAAMKQVPACEYNPIEAIHTNILGAENVIMAARENRVNKVIFISTDKAVNPVNLYGATKLCAEKLFINANNYSFEGRPIFSCTRYGNVIGSRGSVIPLFLQQREKGKITITDPEMTRFWVRVEDGVRFVLSCIEEMAGGEIFIPKLESRRVMDIAEEIAPECEKEIIGIRPGEKLHEILISPEEARNTITLKDRFIILPDNTYYVNEKWISYPKVRDGFSYTSERNIKEEKE